MKNKLFAVVCVLLMLCMGSIFAAETTKEFLVSFEKFVVEVEKAAADGDVSNYADFVASYKDFLKTYEASDDADWTYDDVMAFSALSQRYSVALIELSGGSADDLYGAYGF